MKQTYPKVVRVDHEVHYKLTNFSTPNFVLGTQYVSGKAGSDISLHSGPPRGAQELGDEGDKVDVEYIWPSKGAVVAIKRWHLYDWSRRMNPSTLPSVDSVKKILLERFGPPTVTSTTAAQNTHGLLMGGTFATITWSWAESPSAIRGDKITPKCTDAHTFQFSSRDDPAAIISPAPNCGTYLTVEVETIQNDYVETLTQTLVDGRAVAAAFGRLGTYIRTGEDKQDAALKAHADAAAPKM